MHPHQTPLSLNDPPSSSSGSSIVAPTSPYQPAVPAQRVQHSSLLQSNTHIDPSPTINHSPSPEQQDAVAILQLLPDDSIFAWLRGFRSFFRGEELFNPSQIPPQQRQAVSALKDCPDGLVLEWVTLARSIGTFNASQNLHGNSDFNNDRVATHSSSQLPSSFYDTSINTTPNLSRDASVWAQSSSAATSNLHLHWCHICHNEQPSTTCYGYKRHMREQHEKPFYCMPLGSVEHTEDGPRCAFCGNPNPDPEHLSTHNVQLCESKPRTARRYARKHLLNNHLKHHNVIDGSALVEKWRGDIDMKKYHACGLCVSCFGSFTELVNHIDDKHWKFAEEISHWDRNKVIRGLLSRPEVNDCWRRILAEYPRSHESCFTWEPKIAKSLQSLLEMGEETVDALAARAFNQSDNYGMTGAGFAGPMRDTSQWMQTLQPPHGWPPLPSNLNQDFTAYTDAPPITTLTRHSQQQDRDYADPENSNGTGAFLSRSASQITSGAYGSSTSTARRHFGYLAQPPFSSSSRESIIRQQHPAYMLLTVSPSVTAQASETGTPHSSRHGTHLQDVSPIVVTNPRSRQVAEAGAYPARGHTGRSHPTSATQSTPLPLPYNCPTPSLGQVNSPSSPRNYRNAVAQHQDQGYVDDDDMVVDSELDESQHIIQDWDHSGS